ncbi:MAG: deoxycytidine triphosphate deaminase [Candidatus Melainabacteria bacterium]|nr:deoxycytidine triphosphate deaminase [Candidatus Melainabacteria bacterium]
MAFWSSEKLKERAANKTLITPYYESQVKHGAYEMSLGHEAFITSDDKGMKQPLAEGEQFVIPPGQFGLLITKEEIQIPPDAMGFISIKASIKFSGLVNVSGFHVDPGFSGKLKFSVYNAGSRNVVLTNGQSVFLIWFSDLDRTTSDLYSGDHANQREISSQDVMRIQGEVHSPAALDKRLTGLENSVSTIKTIAIGIGSGLVLLIIGFVVNHFWDK